MLNASNLATHRRARAYPRKLLSAITAIPIPRLQSLESRKGEPWFDEALMLARAFNIGVYDLFTAHELKAFDYDPRFFAVDLKFWGDGVRLPVSVALRLAHRFGVSPDDLDPSPLLRQIWSVVSANERHPYAAGVCPWCQADIFAGDAHEAHCLPHLLLGTYNERRGVPEPGTAEPPRPVHKGSRQGSARVFGIKAVREQLGITQAEMARNMDVNVNHYARIERGELPLTLARTEALCQQLNISRDVLFSAPDEHPVGSSDTSAKTLA